jgi:hypothetical protein
VKQTELLSKTFSIRLMDSGKTYTGSLMRVKLEGEAVIPELTKAWHLTPQREEGIADMLVALCSEALA